MRFYVLFLALFLALSVGACHSASVTPATSAIEFAPNPERRTNLPLIAVLAPPSRAVEPLINTLRSELKQDFDVYVEAVTSKTKDEELAAWLDRNQPKVVVVVDNPTVTHYAGWVRKQPAPPASIIVMASFAEDLHMALPNATAISFEPPAVTMLTDLRRILDTKVRRAGVLYRPGFGDFVKRESKRASLEKIEVIAIEVPSSPTPRDVTRALRRLGRAEIDVLWVTNDNRLLSADLLSQAWLPYAHTATLPILVGVPSLVRAEPHFGTYAAVADIEALGVQTSDLIFDLERTDYVVNERGAQPALSFKTYLDVAQARHLGISKSAELLVDQLVTGDER